MQPALHFILSLVAGLGIGLHLEDKAKKYFMIFLMAIITTSVDLDHLLPLYSESNIKVLHNIFIFIFLPVGLLLFFLVYERGSGSSVKQRFSLMLCVMFSGHMFSDVIAGGGVALFYPFSTQTLTVGDIGITIDSLIISLSADQVLFMIWGATILCANLAETFTYNDVEGRKQPETFLKDTQAYKRTKKTWTPWSFNPLTIRERDFPTNVATANPKSKVRYRNFLTTKQSLPPPGVMNFNVESAVDEIEVMPFTSLKSHIELTDSEQVRFFHTLYEGDIAKYIFDFVDHLEEE